MSLLINDELIWVSIPKNASHSIENSLYLSNLKIENFDSKLNNLNPSNPKFLHKHHKLDDMCKYWKNKKSICVKRDFVDRWISALSYTWDQFKKKELSPIIEYEDIDNNFIYKTFDKKFSDILYGHDGRVEIIKYLIKDKLNEDSLFENRISVFFSQNYWLGLSKNCDYEFNINELDKLVDFIENKYGEKLLLNKFNVSKKQRNKIIINNEFKNHIWEIFEKPFVKTKKIL